MIVVDVDESGSENAVQFGQAMRTQDVERAHAP